MLNEDVSDLLGDGSCIQGLHLQRLILTHEAMGIRPQPKRYDQLSSPDRNANLLITPTTLHKARGNHRHESVHGPQSTLDFSLPLPCRFNIIMGDEGSYVVLSQCLL